MNRPIKVYASRFGRSVIGYGWRCTVPGCGQMQFPYWSQPGPAADAAQRHLRARHADALRITQLGRVTVR